MFDMVRVLYQEAAAGRSGDVPASGHNASAFKILDPEILNDQLSFALMLLVRKVQRTR